MDYAMSDGVDLIFVPYHTVVLAEKDREDVFDRCDMVENIARDLNLVTIVPNVREHCTAHPNPFYHSFRENALRIGIDELILDGGTSAIKDECFHGRFRKEWSREESRTPNPNTREWWASFEDHPE